MLGWMGVHSVPLHMFGLQPALQLCWVPEGSILLRSLRRPESSHSAGLVMISSKRLSRPLSCQHKLATDSVGKTRGGGGRELREKGGRKVNGRTIEAGLP